MPHLRGDSVFHRFAIPPAPHNFVTKRCPSPSTDSWVKVCLPGLARRLLTPVTVPFLAALQGEAGTSISTGSRLRTRSMARLRLSRRRLPSSLTPQLAKPPERPEAGSPGEAAEATPATPPATPLWAGTERRGAWPGRSGACSPFARSHAWLALSGSCAAQSPRRYGRFSPEASLECRRRERHWLHCGDQEVPLCLGGGGAEAEVFAGMETHGGRGGSVQRHSYPPHVLRLIPQPL